MNQKIDLVLLCLIDVSSSLLPLMFTGKNNKGYQKGNQLQQNNRKNKQKPTSYQAPQKDVITMKSPVKIDPVPVKTEQEKKGKCSRNPFLLMKQ